MLFGKRKGQKRDSLGGALISAGDARQAPASLTGTACGRLRSVPLSFPKPFHQVPDGLPGTRTCSLMPVSRLFGGLFFTMDRIAAGTQRLPGCRLLSLLVAACAVTGTACPAFGLFPQRLFCCFYVSLHGRQKPSSPSLPFFFEYPPPVPGTVIRALLPAGHLPHRLRLFLRLPHPLLSRSGEMTGLAPSGGDVPYRPE